MNTHWPHTPNTPDTRTCPRASRERDRASSTSLLSKLSSIAYASSLQGLGLGSEFSLETAHVSWAARQAEGAGLGFRV